MRVEFPILAKAIELSPKGTFSVLSGGLDTVEVERVPATIPALAALLVIVPDGESELGEHCLLIQVCGPQGEELGLLKTTFQLIRHPEHPSIVENFLYAAQMPGMPVHNAGVHEIRFSVDGQMLRSIPLFVKVAAKEERK